MNFKFKVPLFNQHLSVPRSFGIIFIAEIIQFKFFLFSIQNDLSCTKQRKTCHENQFFIKKYFP